MPNILDLSARLSADVRPFVGSISGSAQASASSFQMIAQAASMYLGGRGLLGTLNSANQAAMSFGQSMADASAISVLSIKQLKDTVLGLDNVFGRASKASESMYRILSSGFSKLGTRELQEFQRAVGVSSKVIRADLYSTADVMTTIANAYQLNIDQIKKLQDWFYLTVREGKARGQDLARTLGLVINSASEAGVSLNELGAAIAVLSRTQSVSQSMIGLNQMLNAFIKPTLNAQKAARKWGIELSATALQTRGLTSFLQELHEKVGGNVEALEAMFGNIRAGRAILSLTGKQFKNYMDVLETYNTEQGGGAEAFEKQINTLQNAYERFQTQQEKTLIQIGEDWEGVRKRIYNTGEALLKAFSDMSPLSRWSMYLVGINLAVKNIIAVVRNLRNSVDRTSQAVDRMTAAFTRASIASKNLGGGFRPDTAAYRRMIADELRIITGVGSKGNILTASLASTLNQAPGGRLRNPDVDPYSFITQNTLVRGVPEHEAIAEQIARQQIARQFYLSNVTRNAQGEIISRSFKRHGDSMEYPESTLVSLYKDNVFAVRDKWVKDSLKQVDNSYANIMSGKVNEDIALADARRRVGAFYSQPNKGFRIGTVNANAAANSIPRSTAETNRLMAESVRKVTAQTQRTLSNLAKMKPERFDMRDIQSRSDLKPLISELQRRNDNIFQSRQRRALQLKKDYNAYMRSLNAQNVGAHWASVMEANRPFSNFLPLGVPPASAYGPRHVMYSREASNLANGVFLRNTMSTPKSIKGVPDPEAATFSIKLRNIRYNTLNGIKNAYTSFANDMKLFARDTRDVVKTGWSAFRAKIGSFNAKVPQNYDGTSLARLLNYKARTWDRVHSLLPNPYAKGAFVRDMIIEGNRATPSGSGMLGGLKHWTAREIFVKPGKLMGDGFMKSVGPAMNTLFIGQLALGVAEWGWNFGKRAAESMELAETGYFRRLGGWLANLTNGTITHMDYKESEREGLQAQLEVVRNSRLRAIQRARTAGMEEEKIEAFNRQFLTAFNETEDLDKAVESLREIVNNFLEDVKKLDTGVVNMTKLEKERQELIEQHKRRGVVDYYTDATRNIITERLTDFSKFEQDDRAMRIAKRAIDENLSDADVRNLIANSRTATEIMADSQDVTGKLYYMRQQEIYDSVMDIYGQAVSRALANDIFEGNIKLSDVKSFYDTIKDTQNAIGYYANGQFSSDDTENSKRFTAKALKYVLSLFENNKGSRDEIEKQIASDFAGPLANTFLQEIIVGLNERLSKIEEDALSLVDMDLDLDDSTSIKMEKYELSKKKADANIKRYNDALEWYKTARQTKLEEAVTSILQETPGLSPSVARKKAEDTLKAIDDLAMTNLEDAKTKTVNLAQTATNQGSSVYQAKMKERQLSYDNSLKAMLSGTNNPASKVADFQALFSAYLTDMVDYAQKAGKTAEEQQVIIDEANKDFLNTLMKDADKRIEQTNNIMNERVSKGTVTEKEFVDKQLEIYKYMYDYYTKMLASYEWSDEQRRELENAISEQVISYNKLIIDSFKSELQNELTEEIDAIELDSLRKRITEREANLRKMAVYSDKLKKIRKRMQGIDPDSEMGRDLRAQEKTLERSYLDARNSVHNGVNQAREQLMSTLSGVISGNLKNGRLTNYGIQHAMNLLSRLSPRFQFDVGGASLQDVMKNARARYSGSTPDVSRAMQQQRRLSEIMDAYITAKQYEDAGIGKNVQTIVTIMGKRQPLYLN